MKKIIISNLIISMLIPTIIFAGISNSGNNQDFISKENNPDYEIKNKVLDKDDFIACPAVYSPVCAQISNQNSPKTFSNSCEAGVAKAKILYNGECGKNDDDNNNQNPNIKPILKSLEVHKLNSGGFTVNFGFDKKANTLLKYYPKNNPNEYGEIEFLNREYVGTEVHPTYTTSSAKKQVNLRPNTEYEIYLINLDDNSFFEMYNIKTGNFQYSGNNNDNINQTNPNNYDLNSSKFKFTSSDKAFSLPNGKPGQTCKDWLKENNIEYFFLKTTLHENLQNPNFKEEHKNLNCIYQVNGDVIINHYEQNPNSQSYPVASAIIRDQNQQPLHQYFTKLGFNSVYYNSLDWEFIENIPDGQWGQSCHDWLKLNGKQNYEVSVIDKYGVIGPTICAYKIKENNVETCLYGGAAGNFVKINNKNQQIKPVKYCDTNILRISTRIAQLKPNTNQENNSNNNQNNDNQNSNTCKIHNIAWANTESKGNDVELFRIESENCEGEEIDFEIYEQDTLSDDKVETKTIRIFKKYQEQELMVKVLDDGFLGGLPEYYIQAKKTKSNSLKIIE